MNIQWSRKRKISLVVHVLYLAITFISGLVAALILWHWWFSRVEGSWVAAGVIVGTIEILSLLGLVLYIARVEWPLISLRHALPFLSIGPLGYELYTLLAANGPLIAYPVSLALTSWFVFLSFKLLHSLEGLFIDPVEAAREHAKEEMGRVATTLARFQETKKAAEAFALSVIPAPALEARRTFSPTPLMLEGNSTTLQLSDTADPRFITLMKLAQVKGESGGWLYNSEQLQAATRADMALVNLVCRVVRSGQVVVT